MEGGFLLTGWLFTFLITNIELDVLLTIHNIHSSKWAIIYIPVSGLLLPCDNVLLHYRKLV
jgi:hypothetical protein